MDVKIISETESARVKALRDYQILDTGEEIQFDSIAWLASYICNAPLAFITFIDDDRQWIKAKVGMETHEIHRVLSFCDYTLREEQNFFTVKDLLSDHRFADLDIVESEPRIRFYAGTSLVSPDGHKIGTICVMDFKPGDLDEKQRQALDILSKEVVLNLQTRKNNCVLKDLLEKAQRFHNLFNNSSELHCITDSEGTIAFVNSSVNELLGYRIDEVVGRNIWAFGVEGERERVMPSVYEAIGRGENRFQVETLIQTKDGSLKWFEWADVIMDGYWLVNGRDITERKAYEMQLKTLTVAVEKSPAGVIIRNEKNEIQWMNEAAENIIDFSLDELKGTDIGDLLVGPETDIETLKYAKDCVQERRAYEIEIVLYKKGGKAVWVLLRNNPIFDGTGTLQSQISIALDITEKKKTEYQLIKARQDAIDLSKSKEVFLSVMSHEMRTPLNAVIGMTRILRAEDPLERQLDNLKILEFSAENLLTLINDVLDYTKIETGNLQLEEVKVDIVELMSKTIESLKFKTEDNGVNLLLSIDPLTPKRVLSDPTRLYQIFMNLLGNAVKFTQKGFVKISSSVIVANEEFATVRFAVEDSGIGIAPEKLSSIFDAYSQAERDTARKYGGTGLGLSITKKLVDLFGSKISVTSVVGQGTCFSFELKLRLVALENLKVEEHAVETAINATVLVVDDNAINRLLARKVLEKWSLIVEFAENGKEAVEKVMAKDYDLVLMDIHMPVMSGEEAVEVIRDLPEVKYQRLPILALTGSVAQDDEGRYSKAGMDGFILKPFDPKILYKELRKFLIQ
ncbi:PAS domain S-box protein [Desertivirga brevis]|uniref:PAS domain S-box protein n=1 Tax=Desertivirga brevis TaxID=2810310 RepID=UPI001A979FBC|nr:PAS domain S-box protein [Pedobacter sp. SYSU D00873]